MTDPNWRPGTEFPTDDMLKSWVGESRAQFLVWNPRGFGVWDFIKPDGYDGYWHCSFRLTAPDYWMLLPEPPEGV